MKPGQRNATGLKIAEWLLIGYRTRYLEIIEGGPKFTDRQIKKEIKENVIPLLQISDITKETKKLKDFYNQGGRLIRIEEEISEEEDGGWYTLEEALLIE